MWDQVLSAAKDNKILQVSPWLMSGLDKLLQVVIDPLEKIDKNFGTYSSLERLLDFGQPQTWRIHRAICTSCFITLMIQGCSSISFGVGRVTELIISLKTP